MSAGKAYDVLPRLDLRSKVGLALNFCRDRWWNGVGVGIVLSAWSVGGNRVQEHY